MNNLRAAIIRTLAFQAAWDYAPTKIELAMMIDVGSDVDGVVLSAVFEELNCLISAGEIKEEQARLSLSTYVDLIGRGRENEFYFPRKLRRAQKVTKYLSCLPWVRAVCLCNTTALGQARDESDLDFFVVVKSGTIWRTRFFAALPFKLLGARPLSSRAESSANSDGVEMTKSKDPICLSFFVADNALDLSNLALPNDDPYFRYWFLSMLPLYNDGVLHDLWEASFAIRNRHPLAKEWMAVEGHELKCQMPNAKLRIKTRKSFFESFFEKVQRGSFPENIKLMANKDTRVVVSDDVLKFHVDDKREKFRQKYYDICKSYGIEP